MNIQVLGRDSDGYFYHTGEKSSRNVRIDRTEYDRILDAADKVNTDYRQHSHASGFYLHFDNGFIYQAPQDAPRTDDGKRMVAVGHINGKIETDAAWFARQAELEDYRQTVDGMSYRGQ